MGRPTKKAKIEKLVEKLPINKHKGRQSIAPNLAYDFNKHSYYFYTGKKENKDGKLQATYFISKDPIAVENFIKDFELLDTKKARQNSAMHTKETVSDYLEKFILNQKYEEEATVIYYEQCKKRICKVIGDIQLYELTTDDCEEYINIQSSKYASTTIKKDYDFLKMALNKATTSRKITFNPILPVAPPVRNKEDVRNDIKYYSAEDAYKIIKYCKKNLYKDNYFHNGDRNNVYAWAVLIAITTGLRREEVLGLKIPYVFLEGDTPHLLIEWARTDLCKGYEVKDLKNTSSYRTVSIDNETKKTLEFIIAEYNKNKSNNPNFVDSQFIISYSDGTIPRPVSITLHHKKMLKNIDLSGEILDFKALRHTFGTLTRDGGEATPFELQLAMGHANLATTEKYYLGRTKVISTGASDSFNKMINKHKKAKKATD